jgi:xyloglucan fucosyltransferase
MDAIGSSYGQDLLRIEEASPFTSKKTKKVSVVSPRRRSSVANAVLVALIMTMPPVLLLFRGRLDHPAVWIKSAVAGIGARRGKLQLVHVDALAM